MTDRKTVLTFKERETKITIEEEGTVGVERFAEMLVKIIFASGFDLEDISNEVYSLTNEIIKSNNEGDNRNG